MSEQILLQPIQASDTNKAQESLEKARIAHEKYLIRQQNSDLQEAIEYYIDAVKYDPSMPEAYYRLATLMWEQGQISLDTAIEQCKTAVSIAPKNINAHLYTGFFMKMANDFKSAEAEFKSAIKMGKLKSARPRLILSQSILQKINSENGNISDYLSFLYYFLSGSLMLAWDRPTMKMFYKTCRMIFPFSHTIQSENFWKNLRCILRRKIFTGKLFLQPNTEKFFITKWAIWL